MEREKQFLVASSEDGQREAGRALPWPIVLCLLLSSGYLVFFKDYVEHNAPELFGTLIILCLGIANVFALGCSLQLLFMGTESSSYVKRALRKQTDELAAVITEAQGCLQGFESDLAKTRINLSARGIDTLALLRRVTQALEIRIQEIRTLLRNGSRIALIDADELFRRKLTLDDNAINAIISGDGGLPPIPPEEWTTTVVRLMAELAAEEQRLA